MKLNATKLSWQQELDLLEATFTEDKKREFCDLLERKFHISIDRNDPFTVFIWILDEITKGRLKASRDEVEHIMRIHYYFMGLFVFFWLGILITIIYVR